ncbi:MAG: methyltransferase domain-containing protein [Gammaproteobacteria bacterium]
MASFRQWWQILTAALCSRSNQQFYDRIAPIYDQVFVDHVVHADRMVELLVASQAGQASTTRVLDLGCGTGLLARRLAGQGFAVTGLDISFESLRLMRQSAAFINAVHGDGAQLPFRDGSFQAVVSLGTWRHFREPQRVMDEISRILTTEGRLLIGYFPPSLGGAIHQGQAVWQQWLTRLYQWVVSRRGYIDRTDLSLEPQTLELARGHFDEVRTVTSGESWHLIVAQRPG